MKETTDGFEIAEEDLKIRGPGEVLGRKQSGLPSFKLADLSFDADLLEDVRKSVLNTITLDTLVISIMVDYCYRFECFQKV